MSKDDLERLLTIIQSSKEDIANGRDEWGETEYITVINAERFEQGINDWIDEIASKK